MTAITIGSATAVRGATAKHAAPTKGRLARFWEAFVESRMRHAKREIALYYHLLPEELDRAGQRLTGRSEKNLPFVH